MTDPATPATYIVTLRELTWGGLLVAITLVMHGFGMLATLRFTDAFKQRFEQPPTFASCMSNLILASWCINAVHLLEVTMWAGFFQWHHCFANLSTAGYFALMEYTTVGSDYDLPQRWRLLEGMIATSGLLGFAWSTGVLMTLAQDFQDQQRRWFRQRHPRTAANQDLQTTNHESETQR